MLRLWSTSLLLLSLADGVQATIYSCSTANEGIVFQDRPCAVSVVVASVAAGKQHLPFDIHASWFEHPDHADSRAACDRQDCECGDILRRHEGSLDQAVADALYLDGSWHYYENSHRLWQNAPPNSASSVDLRNRMYDAACNIMISQLLLREFADEVAARLRLQAQAAEERGFDQPEPCEAGVAQACTYLHAVELFNRLQTDAQALKIPRDIVTNRVESPLNR